MHWHTTQRGTNWTRTVGAACAAAWLGVVASAAALSGSQPADDDTLEWVDDYQTALARAQETGRPLLVEFRCAP